MHACLCVSGVSVVCVGVITQEVVRDGVSVEVELPVHVLVPVCVDVRTRVELEDVVAVYHKDVVDVCDTVWEQVSVQVWLWVCVTD